jgi:LPS sulfotransferase NodH
MALVPVGGYYDRSEPLRGYAICTFGRSGSNWLNQVLSSTGALGHPLEYFNLEARRRLTDPDYPEDPAAQINEILTRGATANQVYGLKVFPGHLAAIGDRVEWTRSLPNLRLIHWTRRDLLGQALSLYCASRTAQWRSWETPQATAHYDGPAILAALKGVVRENARWALFFARCGPPALTLDYETTVLNPQAAADAIAAMLELEERPSIRLAAVDLKVQRNETTVVWRKRFVEAYGNPDAFEDL